MTGRPYALILVAAALLLPGCGGSGDEEAAPETATAAQSGGDHAHRVTVTETDFEIALSSRDIHAGEYVFEVVNEGQAPHALEIEGAGIEEKSETIGAGERTELEVTLEPGRYEFYCPVDGHAEKGMKLEVDVDAG